MKVLLFNTTYIEGSTGKIATGLKNYLDLNSHKTMILFGQGIQDKDKNAYCISSRLERRISNFLGRLTGLNNCFSFFSTRKAIRNVKKFRPDVVFCGNLHGHYLNIFKLYRFLAKKKIRVIQTMWDEFPLTGSCSYPYECLKFESKCGDCPHLKDYPISLFFDTSRWLQKKTTYYYERMNIKFVAIPYTARRAKLSSAIGNKVVVSLDEAVDQENLYYPRDVERLRAELGISAEKKVILSVCVFSNPRKGGVYFLELAKKCVNYSDIVFVHVGFNADSSICPPNYIPIGIINDQNVMAEYYSLCDLFVCPSLAETQPSTCLEALSCGAPICGFNISGIPTCAEYPFGQFVDFADIDQLQKIVLTCEKRSSQSQQRTVEYAKARFSARNYYDKLFATMTDW